MLVGGGPEEKYFQLIISSDNSTPRRCTKVHVIITGYLPYSEVPDCLASADIFVSASKTEVHPLTVLEAMASGLPSVVFDTHGTGEILENNIDGIKIKCDDMDDFASAMTKLLISKNIRTDLGKKAIEKSKRYSYLETSKIMLNSYEKAINLHRERIKNEDP